MYTPILNFFFNLDYPYYNGVTLIKKSVLDKINIFTDSHNCTVEMWVKIKFLKNVEIKFIYFNDNIVIQLHQIEKPSLSIDKKGFNMLARRNFYSSTSKYYCKLTFMYLI